MKESKTSPLIICCIVGIVLGYAASFVVTSIDKNRLLTIGLIGGLVVGYLLENKQKTANGGEKMSPSDMLNGKSSEQVKASIQEADDAIARARASISGETTPEVPPASTDAAPAETASEPSAAADSKPAEVTAGQAKINEMEDLFKSARADMDDKNK